MLRLQVVHQHLPDYRGTHFVGTINVQEFLFSYWMDKQISQVRDYSQQILHKRNDSHQLKNQLFCNHSKLQMARWHLMDHFCDIIVNKPPLATSAPNAGAA